MDVLSDYQHGYDCVLERLGFSSSPEMSALSGELQFRVVRVTNSQQEWSRLRVTFDEIRVLRIARGWFVGGGGVLYDGGKVLVEGDDVVVDLDLGVAWPSRGPDGHLSEFRVEGRGRVSLEAV